MEIDSQVFGTPMSTMFDPPEVVVPDAAIETPIVEAEVTPEITPEVTPEVASDVETPIEETTEATEVKPDEEVKTEEAKTDEVKEEVTPVTFDAATELPELKENITKVLDEYELPQPVQAAIDALIAKAEAVPTDSFTEYADYGDSTAVKTLLDRQTYLDSVTETEPGQYRPNTNKFAEEIHKVSPDKADWLHYDLARLPSTKYQGLNKFEEGIADSLAREGDTVQSVITRYNQTMTAMKSGVDIVSDVPSFIPSQFRDAYWSLPKEEREELESFAPELDRIEYDESGRAVNQDEPIRLRKLDTLSKIQKGIDGEKREAQTQVQAEAARKQEFANEVTTTQVKFYDAFRETVTQDVLKNVKFSDDPKMQAILAHQNVAFLGQALEDNAAGEAARQVLKDSGINFDHNKAQQLQKDIEIASVALAQAKSVKDAQGNVLNPIELNKATSQFKKTTEAWQAFAKEIIDPLSRLVSTGKAEDVKAEVAKIKVAPKARVAPKGIGTTAAKEESLPRYKSPEWYQRIAAREQEAEQRRVAAYQ